MLRRCLDTSILSYLLYKISITGGALVERKFESDTRNSFKVNQKILKDILKRNEKCEVGRKYDFENINTVEDFKRKVPITDYSFYERYIDRMTKGEKNIIMSDDVEYFGHTSGTTGSQKLIPATTKSRLIGSKYMAMLMNKYSYDNFKYEYHFGKTLMIADIVMTSYTEGGIPICSATSGGMTAMKSILPYLYTSPIEVLMIEDKESSLYLHILFGLKDKSIVCIGGVFISSVLDLLRIMEENHKDLVRDIRKGCISRRLKIDEKTRKKLNSYLKPDSMRADELEKIFKGGFKACARKIWPNLTYITTVTGANFSIYDDKVNYYTNYIPIYSPVYAATEATIGINKYAGIIRYIIIPDTVFYEFVPVDSKDNTVKTKNIDELKVGEKYEILVTNYAGLYRYSIGDVVRVTGYYNNSPEIVFEYRKNQVLNMVSEKTNEQQLVSAIKNINKAYNIDIVDYTTEPDNDVSPGRYIIYMELRRDIDKKYILKVEKELDKELSRTNPAYNRARYNYKLSRLKIVLVKRNTFNRIKESMYHDGVSKNQIKIPRVVNRKSIKDIINNNILIL